jgi:uncharacterized protein (DUF433 family)
MAAMKKPAPAPAAVVSDPSVMSGAPVIGGTRIPADTIVAYLRAGRSHREIFEDYPTLPVDGIDAVVVWASATYGPEWKSKELAPGGAH